MLISLGLFVCKELLAELIYFILLVLPGVLLMLIMSMYVIAPTRCPECSLPLCSLSCPGREDIHRWALILPLGHWSIHWGNGIATGALDLPLGYRAERACSTGHWDSQSGSGTLLAVSH